MSGGTGTLRLRLLGGCEISAGGEAIHLESARTTGLLAWLALSPGEHARGKLANLLWPDLSGDRSAAALRRAIWDIRRKLSPAGGPLPLRVSRASVGFDSGAPCENDAARFVALLEPARRGPALAAGPTPEAAEQAEEAVSLYLGPLLDGLADVGAPEFDDWLIAERERFRLLAQAALQFLVTSSRKAGEPARALSHARRLLALDPWLEEAHRWVAELLFLTGRRGAALRQMEACRRILADEVGTAPSPESIACEARFRAGLAGAPGAVDLGREPPGPAPNPLSDLPMASTPFVGRSEELDLMDRHLADPACRLLTLLGPGGIGKSRLALRCASRIVEGGRAVSSPFPDGVLWIEPPGEGSPGHLAGSLARALGLLSGGSDDVEERVVAALAERRVLVLLDGFEHRLRESGLVTRLLGTCLEVKVLVTSRERLRLPGEWVLEVAGLGWPKELSKGDPSRFPAVQLFFASARRGRIGFDADRAALSAVVSICQALDGMPLAIEMAASWAHALPPAELAAQVGRGLDFLRSPLRDAPEGQRSLRAVFERAYARLAGEEKRVLRALSVFAGGMTWEAAVEVAGASPESLRDLADRSFLRLDGSSGRYASHEVLRSFAREELDAERIERERASSRHAAFFGALLDRLAEAVCTRSEAEALEMLAADLENIGAAWCSWRESGEPEPLVRRLGVLAACHEVWGWFAEGERLAEEAVESLSARGGKSAAAAALVVRARFRLRLGKVDEAAADLEEGLRRFGRGSGPQRAEALLHLGHALLVRGKFVDARARLEEAISLARRHGRARLLVDALDRLGHASLDEGRLEEARALFDESLRRAHALPSEAAVAHATAELGLVDYFAGDLDAAGKRLDEGVRRARALGNRALLADALNGLAFVAEDRGDLDGAAALYRESLSVCREEGDRFGAGRALMLLGENDRRRGDPEGARRWYEASLELNRAIGSTYACGLLEGNLAYLAASEGMEERASAHAAEAFRAYRETGSMTVGIPVLVALAEVFVGRGEIARALALLGCARDHPGNRQDHRFEIERVLARVRREAPGADLPAGLAKGAGRSLEKLADSALGRLR